MACIAEPPLFCFLSFASFSLPPPRFIIFFFFFAKNYRRYRSAATAATMNVSLRFSPRWTAEKVTSRNSTHPAPRNVPRDSALDRKIAWHVGEEDSIGPGARFVPFLVVHVGARQRSERGADYTGNPLREQWTGKNEAGKRERLSVEVEEWSLMECPVRRARFVSEGLGRSCREGERRSHTRRFLRWRRNAAWFASPERATRPGDVSRSLGTSGRYGFIDRNLRMASSSLVDDRPSPSGRHHTEDRRETRQTRSSWRCSVPLVMRRCTRLLATDADGTYTRLCVNSVVMTFGEKGLREGIYIA